MDKHRLTQVGRAMKELGVQMIAAYSPQARGRSERSFGTWQGRLPQELRLAGISTWRAPIAFCGSGTSGSSTPSSGAGGGERHGVSADGAERSELDLHGADGTGGGQGQHGGDRGPVVADRQDADSATRLAGSTVTIHEHLDETVSIRYGPHVVGRYQQHGRKADQRDNQRAPWKRREHGSRRKPKAGFHRLPHSLGNLAKSARFPLSHRADYGLSVLKGNRKPRRLAPPDYTKRTDHVLIKPDNLTC